MKRLEGVSGCPELCELRTCCFVIPPKGTPSAYDTHKNTEAMHSHLSAWLCHVGLLQAEKPSNWPSRLLPKAGYSNSPAVDDYLVDRVHRGEKKLDS